MQVVKLSISTAGFGLKNLKNQFRNLLLLSAPLGYEICPLFHFLLSVPYSNTFYGQGTRE